MHRLTAILLLGLSAGLGLAQSSTVSRSGQFVIHGVPMGQGYPYVPEVTGNRKLIKLEPALLAVSCERIKQALLNALNVPDQWRGKVQLVLHPPREPNEEIEVAVTRYADAWNYQMSIADSVDPDRFVRAITQVLLLEIANRQLPPQSASLPLWLAEGMPRYLRAVSDVDLVLRPAAAGLRTGDLPQRIDQREGRYLSPFARAREHLRQRSPLTIQQLSHPAPGQLEGLDGEIYRDTTLFLISELLQLKNGGACLFAMLSELPWDPDWRVGFLKAFKPHFQREIDFEKWWAVQSAYFAARDSTQTWPRRESVTKLEEVLRTPFEVRLGSNEPALYTDVSLQAIIKGWKLDRQLPVLREKLNLLDQLQIRIAPELRPLLRQYRDVLARYLDKQDPSLAKTPESSTGKHPLTTFRPKPARAPKETDPLVKQTLAQLDILDARCSAWRYARDKLPEATATNAPPNFLPSEPKRAEAGSTVR